MKELVLVDFHQIYEKQQKLFVTNVTDMSVEMIHNCTSTWILYRYHLWRGDMRIGATGIVLVKFPTLGTGVNKITVSGKIARDGTKEVFKCTTYTQLPHHLNIDTCLIPSDQQSCLIASTTEKKKSALTTGQSHSRTPPTR